MTCTLLAGLWLCTFCFTGISSASSGVSPTRFSYLSTTARTTGAEVFPTFSTIPPLWRITTKGGHISPEPSPEPTPSQEQTPTPSTNSSSSEEQNHLQLGAVCKKQNGLQWTCTKKDDCRSVHQETGNSGLGSCGTVDKEPVVCCKPVGMKAQAKCVEYGELAKKKVLNPVTGNFHYEDDCPILEPLITGGTDASGREFPHMVVLGAGNKADISWSCGGTLISDQFVLTAGHCTPPGSTSSYFRMRWAMVGARSLSEARKAEEITKGQADPKIYEVTKYHIHPQYLKSKNALGLLMRNDIALYKLKEKVEFSSFVRPACLQTETPISNSYAIATGWGLMGNRSKADTLQKVNLTLYLGEECYKSQIKTGQTESNIDKKSMICAGDIPAGKDTCNEDSGGPLQIVIDDPECMYRVLGLTSYGASPCGRIRPAVYTRISHFIEFIEDTVWPSSD